MFRSRGYVLLASLLSAHLAVASESDEARRVMTEVDRRYTGDTVVSRLEMTMIDSRGQRRERVFRSFQKSFGRDDHQILFIESPPDVRNSGFLIYDYHAASRPDDQWLYLPALGKTKRLASDKRESFFGSDFSYADLSRIPIESYDFELLQETELRGSAVWVIKGTPTTDAERERTGYAFSVFFVRKDNFVVIRGLFRFAQGGRAKYLEIPELAEFDGVWLGTELRMTTREGDRVVHETWLRREGVVINQPIDDDFFSLRSLERGL